MLGVTDASYPVTEKRALPEESNPQIFIGDKPQNTSAYVGRWLAG